MEISKSTADKAIRAGTAREVGTNTATATPDPKRCLCGHSSEMHSHVLSEGVRPCLAIEWRATPCGCDTFQSSAWSVPR